MRTTFLRHSLAVGTCVLAAACGRSPDAPVASSLRTRWVATQPRWAEPRPVIAGDRVFAVDADGFLIARDRRDGAVRWRRRVAGQTPESAALLEAQGVILAPGTVSVAGVDAVTGELRWDVFTPDDTVDYSGPGYLGGNTAATDGATIFVPAWGASVMAVDVLTGAQRWVWRPGRLPSDTAASGVFRSGAVGAIVAGDTVYVTVWHSRTRLGGDGEHYLFALDRTTGRELWSWVAPRLWGGVNAVGAPVVHGRLVIFAMRGAYVYAVDRFGRTLAWSREGPTGDAATSTGPELRDGILYLDGGAYDVVALDAETGRQRWRTVLNMQGSTPLHVSTGRVYFTSGMYLTVLDRASGRIVARVRQPDADSKAGGVFGGAVATAGGEGYVSVYDGLWGFREP